MFSFSNRDPSQTSSTPTKGYLAFPAGFSLTPEQKLKKLRERSQREAQVLEDERATASEAASASDQACADRDRVWQEHLTAESERRRIRELREREEALVGEKAWVRAGGVLRDADGRRDRKRTEEVKKLVEEEDRLRRARERWEAYERAWTALLASGAPVAWADVPWPLVERPASVEGLGLLRDPMAIGKFLFETVTEGGRTRRERIRTSLLRWHPDKLGGVLGRVHEGEEREAVKDGVDAVVMSLMALQDTERGGNFES